MLLDELLAERERALTPVTPTPPPALTVDPVAVPPALDTSRRAIRQRLAELESAAVRNYRSAEEARRVLADEHQRLDQELTARTHAQSEAAALRRELDRLNNEETRRATQERVKAERAARAVVADELKRFQQEHERVLEEMAVLRSALAEHDGLLDEYVTRLRDEQGARAALRAELERADAARSLAERALQRATENARHGAEDEMIRLATLEQQLTDASSDRDRLATKLAELSAGDGAIGQMNARLEEKDAQLRQLGARVAELGDRIEEAETAALEARVERDDAIAARERADADLREVGRHNADADVATGVASSRIAELEAEMAERADAAEARAREIDRTLGKLRREARDASNARRTAEGELATAEAEREELRARVADLEAETVRARADGDRLRAHAATLGDELAAARATVTELQAAAPAHLVAPPEPVAPAASVAAPVAAPEESREVSREESPEAETPPPLPLRIAGRHAPIAQVVRRRPRRDPALSAPADLVRAPDTTTPERSVAPIAPAWVAAIEVETAPGTEPAPVESTVAEQAVATDPAATAARPSVTDDTFRRTAFAEFTALASSGDDSRRR